MPRGVYQHKKGYKHSDETKRKIGSANKGKKYVNSGMSGKQHSVESKLKMRKAKIGIKYINRKKPEPFTEEHRKRIGQAHKGEMNGSWKGGVSFDKKYRSWVKNKRNRIKLRLNINGNYHTFGEWELLKVRYNWTCPCCKKSEPEIKLTEDHIIPLSKGGSDLIENIQPLCKSCNCKKHTKIIYY